jgi:adenine-specific DNA-methyltransferase
MKLSKQQIFENTLSHSYNLEDFAKFSREFLTGLKISSVTAHKPPQNFSEHVKEFYTLGKLNDIAVIAVNLNKNKSVERARSVQRNFVKKLLENNFEVDGALVAFYSDATPEKWRLSFVRLEHEFIAGKGGTLKITPAKRYSYLVGENEPCTTALQQLFPIFENDSDCVTLDELEEAFSVERVTKEFFDKYAEKFYQVKKYLEENEDFKTESKAHGFTAEQFAKKLLGQIVFLYFLQKKGWLGVEKNSEWGTGSPNFIRDIFNANKPTGKNFFDEVLEPLFYTALNVDRSSQNDLYPKLNLRIPFLNGGLFEQLDNYDWQKNNFSIPDEIFSNEEEKGRGDADGILDIFDRYNFTINEDEPTEREVAIDPEMLGKVFENLLDVSDRKSKGAFYTPREIVHYMCRETLISYLVEKSKVSEDAIRNFILYGDYFKDDDTLNFAENQNLQISEEIFSPAKNINRLAELDKFLQDVKVADLAVGSGAFPLGMLNEITKAREVLTTYLNLDKSEKITRRLYDLKIETIKNSIFACDIEPSAVDIAKLRLWLTIVIEDEPTADKISFKPKPLPNLDSNIICGNSLIDEFEGVPLIKTSRYLNNLQDGQTSLLQLDFDINLLNIISLQDRLFSETDHDRKEDLRRQIRNLYDETVINQFEGKNSKLESAYLKAATQKSLPFILWQLYFPKVFKDNSGFDIIIGNPPYIGEEGHKELFREIANTEFGKKYHTGKMDFWYFFLSKSIELLKCNGFLSFIAPNNWMTTAGGKNMRSHIAKEATIKSFITFNNVMIFENASQQTMIFILEKKSARQLYKFKYKEVGNRNLNGQELTEFLNGEKIGAAYETNYNPTENIDGRPIQFLNKTVTELIEKIKGGSKIFLDKDEMINGIHPHHGFVTKKMLKFLSPQAKVGDGIFILSLEEINQMDIPKNERTLLKPYYNSENVGRYYFNADNHYEIIYTTSKFKNVKLMEPYPILKKHLDAYVEVITSDNRPYGLSRARKEKFFENPKIVSLRKCAVPTFSYIDKPAYFTAEWYCIITERIDMKYLTCLLNSSLIKFWLLKMGKMQGNIFQVDKAPLENIPIQVPDLESENQIVKLYNLITAAKKTNRYADTTEFELEVDKIIYRLYGLTDEEINFVKNFELEIRIGTDETD